MTYDNLDSKLVNALLDDGRSSLRSLAEELNVSVTTVSNHLTDLEEEGVIEGFRPDIDYDKVGYDVTAVLQLKVSGSGLQQVVEDLEEEPVMLSVYEVTGDHDIIAIAKFTDTDEMNDQIKELLSDEYIENSNTSVVLNAPKEGVQFPLPVDE